MKQSKNLWSLFITFFKLGLFTFGGGYAMIPLIQTEVVENRKWIPAAELFNVIVIAESTPGPISVNAATYIGYKVGGFLGALLATLGLVLPSFFIILAISYVLQPFMAYQIVRNGFMGIQAAVAILIINAAITLAKKVEKGWISLILVAIVFAIQITLTILNLAISSIFFILFGFVFGFVYYGLIHQNKEGK